jgi:hypothetical protein
MKHGKAITPVGHLVDVSTAPQIFQALSLPRDIVEALGNMKLDAPILVENEDATAIDLQ